MRKILSALLAAILFCPIVNNRVLAKDGMTALNRELFSYFGIEIGSDEKLTRGEYADWITRISGAENTSEKATFSDVSKTYRYYDSVEAATAAGYFKGKSKNVFGKDEEVTYSQVIAPLVRLTGYDYYAVKMGDMPKGYMYAAQKAGFGTGHGADDVITRAEAAAICSEAFETKVLVTGLSKGKIERSDDNVLEFYRSIYKSRGLVTGNEYTDMYSQRGIRSGKIYIDKAEYFVENRKYNSLISKKIDFYYISERGSDAPTLAAASVANDGNILCVRASGKNTFSDGKFTYERENGKTETITVEKGYDLILNNGAILDGDESSLLFEEGELEFIDNNADGIYESIVARRAESFVIKGIDLFAEIIYYDGGKVQTDSMDGKNFSIFYNVASDGSQEKIGLDYLNQGMVLTVYRSEDGSYVEGYQYDRQITGKITQTDEDYIWIDDVKYEFLPSAVGDFGLNSSVVVNIDYLGYAVNFEEESPKYRYGYLFKTLTDSRNKAKFKVFTTERFEEFDVENNIYIDGNKTDIEDLKKNSALFDGNNSKPQIIRYRMKKGKLAYIDTLETRAGGEDDSLVCSVPKKTMTYYPGFPMVGGNVKITSNTLFLAVPSMDEELTDEKCYTYSYSFKGYPSGYSFAVYDIKDDLSAGAVLLYPAGSMKSDDETEVTSRVGIVKKVSNAVDEDGNDVKKIILYTENNKMETFYTEDDKCRGFDAEFGTVAEYIVKDGKITGIKAEFSPGEKPEDAAEPSTPSSSDYLFRFGIIKDIYDTYFALVSNAGNPGYDSSHENMWISPLSAEKYIVVDIQQKKINTGSAVNLHGGAYVFIRNFRGYRNLHFVIYKY